jgi:hypothetical protein
MVFMLAGLTLFFFISSFVQLVHLENRVIGAPELDLGPAMRTLDGRGSESLDKLQVAQWKALVTLEGAALERRYHQANALLLSRIWTRYLGFVTGMILALVGSAYILGRLREPLSKFETEGVMKVVVTTTSPGIILAVLGTILMVVTITTQFEIAVKDSALYTNAWLRPASETKPVDLPHKGTPPEDQATPQPTPPAFDRLREKCLKPDQGVCK